ncbi:hypothetical protein NTE_00279 [Candidatus Nitrososphaera evergladensis SR1]|uniref:Uncharacterized protein n=1 Tax=Candidatus Nitrososphaera evergladensis SR1 TaxID=1459636 RepID=A0A075MLL1_9ARCH|nr:hypothetical protein [Candidatus Nitrososphaera evergladensis]AIF82361.1 hypothetical protein NTE_00279 [Candidatus Nitrososphaera evergladensis SR1]
MKIGKAISIELDDGQRLSLSLKEAGELYLKLGKMLTYDREAGKNKSGRKSRTTFARSSNTTVTLSDAKRQEILAHLNKQISDTPRTLTNLLKGAKYSPSQLPLIRNMVESQQSIKAKAKGKRILYLRKRIKAIATKAAKGT